MLIVFSKILIQVWLIRIIYSLVNFWSLVHKKHLDKTEIKEIKKVKNKDKKNYLWYTKQVLYLPSNSR